MKIFNKLKIGDRIKDSWYGYGWVKARSSRRISIKLDLEREIWHYDKEHINTFVKRCFKGAK